MGAIDKAGAPRSALRLVLGILLGLCSCVAAGAQQTLEVFAQSGMSMAHGDPGGITYTFTFDQEGLIRSYKEVGSTGVVLRSFEVRRDGADIIPVYKTNNLSSWVKSVHLGSGTLSVMTSRMREGDNLEVRPVTTSQSDEELFEHVYNGTTSVVFGFGGTETRLEYPPRSEAFQYRLSKEGGSTDCHSYCHSS